MINIFILHVKFFHTYSKYFPCLYSSMFFNLTFPLKANICHLSRPPSFIDSSVCYNRQLDLSCKFVGEGIIYCALIKYAGHCLSKTNLITAACYAWEFSVEHLDWITIVYWLYIYTGSKRKFNQFRNSYCETWHEFYFLW